MPALPKPCARPNGVVERMALRPARRDLAAGPGLARRAPHATVKVANHEAPLWVVESAGKAVFVGEVAASWVWLVLWPDTAGALLIEPLALRDLRDPEQDLDLPFGALFPRPPAQGRRL